VANRSIDSHHQKNSDLTLRLKCAREGAKVTSIDFKLSNGNQETIEVRGFEIDDRALAVGLASDLFDNAWKAFEIELNQGGEDGKILIERSYETLRRQMRAIVFDDKSEFRKQFSDFEAAAGLAKKSGKLSDYNGALKQLADFMGEMRSALNVDYGKKREGFQDIPLGKKKNSRQINPANEHLSASRRGKVTDSSSHGGAMTASSDDELLLSGSDVGRLHSEPVVQEIPTKRKGLPKNGKRADVKRASKTPTPEVKKKLAEQKKYRNTEVRLGKKTNGDVGNIFSPRVTREQELSKRGLERLTAESDRLIIQGVMDDTGKYTANLESRDGYLKPLDGLHPKLQTTDRRREEFGRDALIWQDIMEQEIKRDSISYDLLSNMLRLLAAACEGVSMHSQDKYKLEDLEGMRKYFEAQAAEFSREGRRGVNRKGLAISVSKLGKTYTRQIVKYSKFKLPPRV
jgi:hypothetical protein